MTEILKIPESHKDFDIITWCETCQIILYAQEHGSTMAEYTAGYAKRAHQEDAPGHYIFVVKQGEQDDNQREAN